MAVKVTNRPKGELGVDPNIPIEMIDFEVEPSLQVMEPEKLPAFPAKEIPASRAQLFWDWKASLTNENWNHITMLLYREEPYIDRKQVDPNANVNIEVFCSPWDHTGKTFLTTHGSGSYKVIINDSNKAVKGKGGMVGIARFVVNEPNYPPIFVLEELVVDHKSNRTIVAKLMAEGKLTIEGKPMTQQGGTDNNALIALLTRMIEKQGNQPPKDSTAESISQMFVKANDTMLGMVKDQAKSDDPEKLVKMLAALKDMLPKAESGNEMLTLVVKMQGDMAKVQADSQAARETLMLKMMEMMNSKPSSDDAEDKVLSRIATYKELFGGDSGGRTRNPSIPELLIEHGAPVVLKVLETIQGFVNVRNYAAGVAKQQTQPGTEVTNQAPGLPQPQVPNPQAPTDGKVVEMPPTAQQQLISLIKGPAGPLVLGAIQRNETGDSFADSLVGMLGRLTYDQIAVTGKEAIISAMKEVPEFWSQVTPQTMDKFVDEFIKYGTEEQEEEE